MKRKPTLDLKEKFIDDLEMMQTMASLYVEMDGNGKWMDTVDFFFNKAITRHVLYTEK